MGVGETAAFEAPQCEGGEGVQDGSGERYPAELRGREMSDRVGKPE